MATITINRKQSNTGTIYDLASERGDIEIKFTAKRKFAVLLPSYYNGGITMHATAEAAAKAAGKLLNQDYQGVRIIADNGKVFELDGFRGALVETDRSYATA